MSDEAQTPGAPAHEPGDSLRPEDVAPEHRAGARPGVSLGKPAGESDPWAPPADEVPSRVRSSVPSQQSAPPFPGVPDPYAPPGGSAVPPPPVAPGGPGQVPYGYGPGYGPGPPGPGYGHPAYPVHRHHGHHGPSYGGAPGYGYGYGWPALPMPPHNGLGIASLVLGIVSAVGFCLWPVSFAAGVLALIFGLIGRNKVRRGEATNPGHALAGIICGAVGVVLAIAFVVVIAVVPDDAGSDDPGTGGETGGFSTSLAVGG